MPFLTQRYIDTLKHHPDKQTRSRSEAGLKLVLSKKPNKGKSWELTYYIQSQKRRFVFGHYPVDFTLATARIERDRLKSLVRKSICPKEQAEQELRDKQLLDAQRITMKDLRERFDKEYILKKGLKSREPMLAILEKKFCSWDKYEPKDINRLMIVNRLDQIDADGSVMRNRAHAHLSSMFAFAVEKSIIDINHAKSIGKNEEKARRVVLTDNDIRLVWNGIAGYAREPAVIAIKLALITGQRSGEVLSMKPEYLDSDWWTQPDSKNGREHRTYLVPLALDLISEAKKRSSNDLYIFGSGKHGHMKPPTLSTAVARWLESVDVPVTKFTPHDLRRTMTTNLARLGIDRFAQNQILNHADNSIAAVYDVSEYDDLKKAAMMKWESRLKEILDDQN